MNKRNTWRPTPRELLQFSESHFECLRIILLIRLLPESYEITIEKSWTKLLLKDIAMELKSSSRRLTCSDDKSECGGVGFEQYTCIIRMSSIECHLRKENIYLEAVKLFLKISAINIVLDRFTTIRVFLSLHNNVLRFVSYSTYDVSVIRRYISLSFTFVHSWAYLTRQKHFYLYIAASI